MHRGRERDRADGTVGEDVHVIDLSHVGDLFQFGDAATMRGVGLDISYRVFLKDLAEARQPLAGNSATWQRIQRGAGAADGLSLDAFGTMVRTAMEKRR